ncbi:hypothetical protein DFH06DRAFT_269053 [Mycena polygramma]|nr:hypothetical protein DFH06DRAFT_269053 [Mycena polygramma]
MPFAWVDGARQHRAYSTVKDSAPNTFLPRRGFYIPRVVANNNYSDLPTRQKKCLVPTKAEHPWVLLPVLSAVYKANPRHLPNAAGESMYSAVQAAAIAQNAQSNLPHLALSIAQGYVRPMTSEWAGHADSERYGYDASSYPVFPTVVLLTTLVDTPLFQRARF